MLTSLLLKTTEFPFSSTPFSISGTLSPTKVRSLEGSIIILASSPCGLVENTPIPFATFLCEPPDGLF